MAVSQKQPVIISLYDRNIIIFVIKIEFYVAEWLSACVLFEGLRVQISFNFFPKNPLAVVVRLPLVVWNFYRRLFAAGFSFPTFALAAV